MYWKKTEVPEFECRFVQRIYYDSTTRVEFAGMPRGQLLMASGVRQGCPASGFLFAMAFDPIFRWLQDAIIPRNPAGLDFLQPAQCAHGDDLAVAAPSFRDLMTPLAPAREMQVVKYAKYVGTMLGRMAIFTFGQHFEKSFNVS